jgi:hypothetical protein
MSFIEMEHSISLGCDRKNCPNTASVSGGTRDERNKRLYDLGWGLLRGKQICPRHIALWRSRKAKKSECRHESLVRHDYHDETWWQCEQGCDFLFRKQKE